MDWTFHLQTVTRPIANNAIKHNGCWGLVIFPVWVGGNKGSDASRALSGSVKKEKVGHFV